MRELQQFMKEIDLQIRQEAYGAFKRRLEHLGLEGWQYDGIIDAVVDLLWL